MREEAENVNLNARNPYRNAERRNQLQAFLREPKTRRKQILGKNPRNEEIS